MATAKQIAANKANAQKSTGPKSAASKAKVSQNALKHGLCAKFTVLEVAEDQEQYDTFLQQMIEDEQPVGQAEIELVVKMAEYTWLAKRAVRMQNHCFIPEPRTAEHKENRIISYTIDRELENYLRYHTTHDRAYQRASAELQKRKKERRLAEIGFESQKRAQAEEIRKIEDHTVSMAIKNLRRQHQEIQLGSKMADIFGPNLDLSHLNPAFFQAAPGANPPVPGKY